MKFAIHSAARPTRVPDDTTIQKIIDETGIPVVSEFARAALAQDLGRFGRHVELFGLFARRTTAVKANARKKTKQLKAMLTLPDSDLSKEIKESPQMTLMQIDADAQRNDFSSPVSLNEWLITRYMPAIYERAFGRKVGRSSKHRGDEQVAAGPFVRFVTAALAANGITYAKDSVRTAFKRLKKVEDAEGAEKKAEPDANGRETR
jgi:hypothetical protein